MLFWRKKEKSEGMNEDREAKENGKKQINFVKFNNLCWSYLRSTFYDQKMSNTAVLPLKSS